MSPFQIRFFLSKTPRPSHHHHTYQLHAADGCNNSKFRLYEKATYQRGVRNSRLGVKNGTFFFVEHHFSHNCKKKHFSTTANSVYLDSNRIWKKSLPMKTQVGWNVFGYLKTLIFFLLNLTNLHIRTRICYFECGLQKYVCKYYI